MNQTDIPIKMPTAWAQDAVGGGNIVYPVPVSPQSGGQASYEDGYPPPNSVQIAAGGIPPFGNVTNGILRAITLWSQWQQLGGPVPWDSTFSGALASPGYPSGAIVTSATTPNKLWISTVDGNVTNPDAGGAGWLSWPYPFYAVDTGTVNAMAAVLPLPLAAIPVGTTLRINPAFANTGSAPTLRINGGSAVPITTPLGGALVDGAIAYHIPAEIMVAPGPALWLLNPQTGAAAPAAHGIQPYTSPGSYGFVVPSASINVRGWGAGGGGGGGTNSPFLTGGAGGGGGGYGELVITGLTVGNTIGLTVGSGGAGGSGGGDGGAGSPSTFGGYMSLSTGGGGQGGTSGGATPQPGVGGSATVPGGFAVQGGYGSALSLAGGSAPGGGQGGSAPYPGNVPYPATAPGGGGAGGTDDPSYPGGDGMPGAFLITW